LVKFSKQNQSKIISFNNNNIANVQNYRKITEKLKLKDYIVKIDHYKIISENCKKIYFQNRKKPDILT
jgi:hypothetical protein